MIRRFPQEDLAVTRPSCGEFVFVQKLFLILCNIPGTEIGIGR